MDVPRKSLHLMHAQRHWNLNQNRQRVRTKTGGDDVPRGGEIIVSVTFNMMWDE